MRKYLAAAAVALTLAPITAFPATFVVGVTGGVPTQLTAAKPKSGYAVALISTSAGFNVCWIEDNTKAVGLPAGPNPVGFMIGQGLEATTGLQSIYQTPAGYVPPGPLYAYCDSDATIEVRTW